MRVKKGQKRLVKKSEIYVSTRLNVVYPTVKTAALWHVPIKSYSKNTHGSSILKWILGKENK
jgi:hypothetical protein